MQTLRGGQMAGNTSETERTLQILSNIEQSLRMHTVNYKQVQIWTESGTSSYMLSLYSNSICPAFSQSDWLMIGLYRAILPARFSC